MRYRSGERRGTRAIKAGQCGRKARYSVRADANTALFLLAASGRAKGEQRVYRCPHCGAWHVGRK